MPRLISNNNAPVQSDRVKYLVTGTIHKNECDIPHVQGRRPRIFTQELQRHVGVDIYGNEEYRWYYTIVEKRPSGNISLSAPTAIHLLKVNNIPIPVAMLNTLHRYQFHIRDHNIHLDDFSFILTVI